MRERAILFVDDEEKSRKYFGRIFRRKFEVMVAANGEEALEIIAVRGEEIGVVVTDQMMPGMTGLQLLGELQTSAPKLVRILSTAYTDAALMSEAEAGGLIQYFIRKPWEIEQVEATLEAAAEHFAGNGPQSSGSSG